MRPADGFDSAAFAAAQGASHFALAVPGITIPWAHAGYLWVAAAVSLCTHEVRCSAPALTSGNPMFDLQRHLMRLLIRDKGCDFWERFSQHVSLAAAQCGHALAAAAEGVTLHHVALFLVLAMPGAYVALDSEGLAALTPWRVLRVRIAACDGGEQSSRARHLARQHVHAVMQLKQQQRSRVEQQIAWMLGTRVGTQVNGHPVAHAGALRAADCVRGRVAEWPAVLDVLAGGAAAAGAAAAAVLHRPGRRHLVRPHPILCLSYCH